MGRGVPDLGDHGRQVAGVPEVGDGLDQGAVGLDGPGQVRRVVRRTEPAPQHQVGARRDGRRRVDLQLGQALDDGDQVGRARRGEQLRVDRDPAGLVLGQAVGDHAADHSAAPRTASPADPMTHPPSTHHQPSPRFRLGSPAPPGAVTTQVSGPGGADRWTRPPPASPRQFSHIGR